MFFGVFVNLLSGSFQPEFVKKKKKKFFGQETLLYIANSLITFMNGLLLTIYMQQTNAIYIRCG